MLIGPKGGNLTSVTEDETQESKLLLLLLRTPFVEGHLFSFSPYFVEVLVKDERVFNIDLLRFLAIDAQGRRPVKLGRVKSEIGEGGMAVWNGAVGEEEA